MAIVRKPKWPVAQLATWELRDYRERIEHALTGVSEGTADSEQLRKQLAEVVSEQQSRPHPPQSGELI